MRLDNENLANEGRKGRKKEKRERETEGRRGGKKPWGRAGAGWPGRAGGRSEPWGAASE